MTTPWRYVLVPGRHHLMTNYQAEWIHATHTGKHTDNQGKPIHTTPDTIWIFPITSANHHTTRRNPIPLAQRIAQVELFAAAENITALILTLPDLPTTTRFADHVIATVATDLNITLTPDTTLVAVSTPVGGMYAELGYSLGLIEKDGPEGTPTAWDGVLAAAEGNTELFTRIAHPTSINVWNRYNLSEHTRTVFTDTVVSSEDGGLTDTRTYTTYAEAFEQTAQRKWEEIRGWVQPGRIVDVGCATGQLLVEAGKEPTLTNSDLIGIETDRWLHAEAQHRKEQGVFANPNTFFYRRNVLTGPIFNANTITTTITCALTHEIYSYGNKEHDLALLQQFIKQHTRTGGVWINSDTAGPTNPDRIILMKLTDTDGTNAEIIPDIASLPKANATPLLNQQTTWGRFLQYAHDLHAITGVPLNYTVHRQGRVELSIKDAMEFLLHKDYTDNWLSELHETYTYRNWQQWETALLTDGWTIHPHSGGYTNEWIVTNRFVPIASLHDPVTREQLDWPDTHILYAAIKH